MRAWICNYIPYKTVCAIVYRRVYSSSFILARVNAYGFKATINNAEYTVWAEAKCHLAQLIWYNTCWSCQKSNSRIHCHLCCREMKRLTLSRLEETMQLQCVQVHFIDAWKQNWFVSDRCPISVDLTVVAICLVNSCTVSCHSTDVQD